MATSVDKLILHCEFIKALGDYRSGDVELDDALESLHESVDEYIQTLNKETL